jgi:hypothetical protein
MVAIVLALAGIVLLQPLADLVAVLLFMVDSIANDPLVERLAG